MSDRPLSPVTLVPSWHRLSACLWLGVWLWLGAWPWAAAQEAPSTDFYETVEVNVVNVEVYVTDKKGNPVTGLTRDDFEILEDGEPIEISNFYAGQGQPWPLAVYGDYPFTQIVAGLSHTCALLADGRAMCWGDNRQSQIGQPRTEYNYRNFPNLIVGRRTGAD